MEAFTQWTLTKKKLSNTWIRTPVILTLKEEVPIEDYEGFAFIMKTYTLRQAMNYSAITKVLNPIIHSKIDT